jgi:hypothetical protein
MPAQPVSRGNIEHILYHKEFTDARILIPDYRAGTYFDADQKWRTKKHSGFIYEPQNLWRQRFEVSTQLMKIFLT